MRGAVCRGARLRKRLLRAGFRSKGRACLFAGASVLIATSGCAKEAPSVLDPRGPAAREVTGLWWPMLWVATAVFLFVIAMGAWGVVRGRHRGEERIERDVAWGDRFILIAGLGVTSAILVGFFLVSLRSMAALARGDRPGALRITVTAHDWWWEARYPNGAITANEIHIPSGERVLLTLRSDDVIHSLWVPQLGPKVDLVPGRTNETWLQADQPGRYRGQCAEYCGLQHARMIFYVVADPPDVFRRWMRIMAEPAPRPIDAFAARGLEVFQSSTCAGCHTIRGTSATGRLGPDLSRLATRSTFASGTLALDADNLTRWILDPQDLKPGVTMPPTDLTPEEVRAVVAYLLSLGFQDGQ